MTSRLDRDRLRRFVRTAAITVVLTVCGYLGGVGTTSLFPADIHTDYYSAQVSLGLVPDSTARLPTVLGDVALEFDGPLPAPSVIVHAQLRKDVTEAFAGTTPTVSTFRPSSAELDQAARSALAGLAWRFVLGFLLTVALVLGVQGTWRHRRESLIGASIALVISLTAPALGGYFAFRSDHITAVRTTSLLTVARNDSTLLDQLEQRSAQSSRYITSILALSDAVQLKFTPQQSAAPTAVRLLFVSDIHGFNQYALLKDIVRTQHIDAVVDSGDLINFGSVQEAEAAGIFSSIGGLGVPYLFVRGNHDASSATDNTLLDRLASIRNVILLQPKPGTYQKVTVGGVTLGGFNDRRFYGDGDPSKSTLQIEAREDFLRAWRSDNEPMPDIVISHEPEATAKGFPDTSLLVSGHTHVPSHDGNHLGVGTFTGGGLFGARLAEGADKGTEVQTQSYSFDIADYDTTCSLASLRRYTFSGILTGDPQIDSRTTISGHQFVPAQQRTCGGPTQPAVTKVEAR